MINADIPGLLPCPFCGDKRVILSTRPMQPSKIVLHYIVECANCMARGPVTHVLQKKEEDRESACRRARKKAAEGWNNNRRTPEMIREWMDKEACSECGELFHKKDLFETEFGRMCHDCYREMKEVEEMLK